MKSTAHRPHHDGRLVGIQLEVTNHVQKHQDAFQLSATRNGRRDSSGVPPVRQETQRVQQPIQGEQRSVRSRRRGSCRCRASSHRCLGNYSRATRPRDGSNSGTRQGCSTVRPGLDFAAQHERDPTDLTVERHVVTLRVIRDDDQIDAVVQPDILMVCDPAKARRSRHAAPPTGSRKSSPPPSPAIARYDRTTKLSAYERAGVPEVWLMDPTDHTVAIYRIESGRYTQPVALELRGKTAATTVPGGGIESDRLPATQGESS